MVSTQDNAIQAPEVLAGNCDIVTKELTTSIEQSIQPIMVKGYRRGQTFLAVGSLHGQRLMLQINVHASEIPTLLRSRSVDEKSNNPSSGKNRPVNEKHIEAIKDYIIERASSGNKWILGPITANVDPARLQYQKIWGDLHVVFIPNSTALEITDGQHRKRAIVQLIESESDERNLIAEATFPVNLVLEGDFEQCQVDFCDMAQTYPIAKSLLVAYAGFGRDAIAKEVAEQVDMFRNKTQKIKSTPGSRTGHIYTINYIAKLVSCAFAGNTNDKLAEVKTEEAVMHYAEVLSNCLNHFFKACPHSRKIAEQERLHHEHVTEFRNQSILGVSVGLEILGTLLYETYNDEIKSFDTTRIEEIANKINWLKEADIWRNNVVIIGKRKANHSKDELEDGKDVSEEEEDVLRIVAGRSSVSRAVNGCLEALGWEKKAVRK